MNDIHGVAPNAVNTPNELRMLLAGFGPFTSRYILTVPGYKNWHDHLLKNFSHLGDMDQKRLRSILSDAKNKQAFIDKTVDFWPVTQSWPMNALRIWQPNYKPIHVSEEDYLSISTEHPEHTEKIISPTDTYTASPSDEEIDTEPADYWNVSKWLCQISAEIHFIDPYLNPYKSRDISDVLEYYIEQLLKLRKPTYIIFWSRAEKTMTANQTNTNESLIKNLVKNKNIDREISFKFRMVSDATSIDKLHARYLLTEKGGIKFDQGFQRIRPKGRKNIASPIGEPLHRKLFEKFSKSKNDFSIEREIKF
ncbi:MAG: hypothetical protein RLZZ352_730 [Pseudomonadota bacterium]|jgi:hypothetical protein